MPTIETITVLVLYRDPLVRAGLAATLRQHPEFVLAPTEVPMPGTPGQARGPVADVVVADYEHALELVAPALPEKLPRPGRWPGVLIVSRRDSEAEIRHALECGARGYLVLGCGLDELLDGVRTVHRGIRYLGVLAARRLADSVACTPLTCRETDVLRLVSQGRGNKAIARQLDVAIGTVKSHLKSIFGKLDASSRTEVAAIAERRGLLALSPSRMGPRTSAPKGARTAAAGDGTSVSGAAFAQHAQRRIEGRSPSMFGSAVH